MNINNVNLTILPKKNNFQKKQTFKSKDGSSNYIMAKKSNFEVAKLPLAVVLAFSHCKCYETFQNVVKDNGSWKLFISDANIFELPKEKSFGEKIKEMKDLIPPPKICMGIAVFGALAYCVSNVLLKNFKDENKTFIKVKKDNDKTDKDILKKYLLKKTIFQSCLCAIINTGLALCNLRTTKNIYSKLLGAGLSSGVLWMIFSLISDKKTLNQFIKENKQEV